MAERITATLSIPPELLRFVTESSSDVVGNVFSRAFKRSAFKLQEHVARHYLSGPRPTHVDVVTGTLRRSIAVDGIDDSGLPHYIDVGSDLIYGPVHEFGAEIHAHNAPFLVFTPRGAKHPVRKKSVRIPARPFLEPAHEDLIPVYEDILAEEFEREME